MPSRALHAAVVATIAGLGMLLLALAVADMRGLDGRLAAAAQPPVQHVQPQLLRSVDCPEHRHHERTLQQQQQT
jgi:hypothetical protein